MDKTLCHCGPSRAKQSHLTIKHEIASSRQTLLAMTDNAIYYLHPL